MAQPSPAQIARVMTAMRSIEKYSKTGTVLGATAAGTLVNGNVLSVIDKFNIGTGSNEDQRQGNEIWVQSLQLHIMLEPTSGAFWTADLTDPYCMRYRILMLKLDCANEAVSTLTWAKVFTLENNEDYGNAMFRNVDFAPNIHILYDRKGTIPKHITSEVTCAGGSPVAETVTTNYVHPCEKSIKIIKRFRTPINVEYTLDSTTGPLAKITKNDIQLLLWCSEYNATARFNWYVDGRIKWTN